MPVKKTTKRTTKKKTAQKPKPKPLTLRERFNRQEKLIDRQWQLIHALTKTVNENNKMIEAIADALDKRGFGVWY